MGARERHLSGGARVGIHRPSLRAPPAGDAQPGSEDAIVGAMAEQLERYAEDMHVPRTIIDVMMTVPPDRMRFLSPAELTTYGIPVREAVTLQERRAAPPAQRPPSTVPGR
jgi:hypothetical protein